MEPINQKSQLTEQPDPLSQAYYLVPASQKIASTQKPKPQENSKGLPTKTLLTATGILTTLGATYFTYNHKVFSQPTSTSYPFAAKAIPFIVVLAAIAFLARYKPPSPKTPENRQPVLPPQRVSDDSPKISKEELLLLSEMNKICAELTKMLEEINDENALSIYQKINEHLQNLNCSLKDPQKELVFSYTDSLIKKLDGLTPNDLLSVNLSLLLKKVFEKMLAINKNAALEIAKKCVLRLSFHSIYKEIIKTILNETNLGIALTIDCVIKQEACEDKLERQKYQPAINLFLDFFINFTSKLDKFLEECAKLDSVKYALFQKSIIAKFYESEKNCVSANIYNDYLNSIYHHIDARRIFSPSKVLPLKNAPYLNDNLILALRIFLYVKNYNMFLELLNQCKSFFPDQYHELYRQAHHRTKELPQARAFLEKLERPPTFQENEDETSDSPRGPYFTEWPNGRIENFQRLQLY